MELTRREEYVIKRKRKGIRLRQIANYIGCSEALLCKYEKGHLDLKEHVKEMYEKFIDTYREA
jgi:transcriptional regulator with XRE-family HTH domain